MPVNIMHCGKFPDKQLVKPMFLEKIKNKNKKGFVEKTFIKVLHN